MVGFTPIRVGVVVLAVTAAPVRAEVLYVDVANCPGPGDGSEPDPYCSIQAAIDNAVDTDEIVVAPGTYIEKIDFLGKAITLISSDGADVTTIDPPGTGDVVRCTSGEGPDTLFDGFTITGGKPFGAYGHGMFNSGSSPTVNNCIFRDNSTLGNGGGMSNSSSNPTVTNCTFSGNLASTIGGGMYNINSSPTIINCVFTGNSASKGGGMSNVGNSPAVVRYCTFDGNSASSTGGGMTNSASSPTVANCVFAGNSGHLGGGMYSQAGSSPTITNCKFHGNTAVNAGGMYNVGGTPTVINCTFSGNIGNVGGIFNFGGGPTVTNSVLWGNGPASIYNNEGGSVVSFTDVEGGYPGTGNIDADPLFVDPDNGDYRLSPGSPCIDAGDNAAVPAGVLRDLDGKPRFVADACAGAGGAAVDMGAYEFQGTSCDLGDVPTMLAVWGRCGECGDCPWDFDADCEVGIADLLTLLSPARSRNIRSIRWGASARESGRFRP